MNIFALDKDPNRAAQFHCDKHVVKMVLETAQILSTALQNNNWSSKNHQQLKLYKPTHKNHPVVLWTANNPINFLWTVQLGLALETEYEYRYGKNHKSGAVIKTICDFFLGTQQNLGLAHNKRDPFVQCMPDDCKIENDAVNAYRLYYMTEKAYMATWTKRSTPRWFLV